jgi:hypothetical protein|tara:strand:+ start:441 stop:782 length:342 start_codon:yes stop_codon:yes gene_type:complete
MTYADETPKGYTGPTATAIVGVCNPGHQKRKCPHCELNAMERLVAEWKRRAMAALALTTAQADEIEAWEHFAKKLEEQVDEHLRVAPAIVDAAARVNHAQNTTRQVLEDLAAE